MPQVPPAYTRLSPHFIRRYDGWLLYLCPSCLIPHTIHGRNVQNAQDSKQVTANTHVEYLDLKREGTRIVRFYCKSRIGGFDGSTPGHVEFDLSSDRRGPTHLPLIPMPDMFGMDTQP